MGVGLGQLPRHCHQYPHPEPTATQAAAACRPPIAHPHGHAAKAGLRRHPSDVRARDWRVMAPDTKYLYGLADVVRVVRVDFMKPSVQVLTSCAIFTCTFRISAKTAPNGCNGASLTGLFLRQPGKITTPAPAKARLLPVPSRKTLAFCGPHGAINMLVFGPH